MINKTNQLTNTLYICNFPKKTTKQELTQLLQPCGDLVSLNIIQKPEYAFAFVQFDDIRDAAFAVKQFDQKLYKGMNLKVQFKNRKNEQSQEECLKKNVKSEHNSSPIETNCCIPPQKLLQKQNIQRQADQLERIICQEKYQQHKNSQKNNKIKINENLFPKDSHERIGSRSRSKHPKDKYYKKFPLKSRHSGHRNSKQRQRSRSRSIFNHQSGNQSVRYCAQYDVARMFDTIKGLSSNIRKLEEKFSDFVYDWKHRMSFTVERRH